MAPLAVAMIAACLVSGATAADPTTLEEALSQETASHVALEQAMAAGRQQLDLPEFGATARGKTNGTNNGTAPKPKPIKTQSEHASWRRVPALL